MLTLGVGQKPIVQAWYPHMMAGDTAVWSEFLKDPPVKIERVWYDVHVGKQVAGVRSEDVLGNKIAAGLTRKRIDAVIQTSSAYWVIEVKPFAGMVALGQVIAYSRLFAAEYVVDREILPVCVCGEPDPDVIDDFERMAAVLIQV